MARNKALGIGNPAPIDGENASSTAEGSDLPPPPAYDEIFGGTAAIDPNQPPSGPGQYPNYPSPGTAPPPYPQGQLFYGPAPVGYQLPATAYTTGSQAAHKLHYPFTHQPPLQNPLLEQDESAPSSGDDTNQPPQPIPLAFPPPDYTLLSTIVYIFCCRLTGHRALQHSRNSAAAAQNGDQETALRESHNARRWIRNSLITGVLIYMGVIMVIIFTIKFMSSTGSDEDDDDDFFNEP